MASLQGTTINGNLTTNSALLDGEADMSEWYKLSHCVSTNNFLHVRTPISTEASDGLGWNPYILQVVGYHTYAGEFFHDFKAIVNTTGDGNNTFYGSQVRVNVGNAGSVPYVYRSSSTYGGSRRLCFSVGKVAGCAAGYLWVRWWTNAGYRTSFAWATTDTNSSTTAAF